MANRLVATLTFSSIAAGASSAQPHNLNFGGAGRVPDLGFVNSSVFSATADSTNVTVTNNGLVAASCNVLVWCLHSEVRVLGGLANMTPKPVWFIGDGYSAITGLTPGMATYPTEAALAAEPGPAATDPQYAFVAEFNAVYRWAAASVATADDYMVIAPTGGVAGRWLLDGTKITLFPSQGATWTRLLAARVATAGKATLVLAGEAWTMDVATTLATSAPNGLHEIWEPGATINCTVALSPGTVAQNGVWYSTGGTTAPTASTTLNGNVAAGATTMTLTNATGFNVGGWFRVQRGIAYTRTYKIVGKAGSVITLDRPTKRTFNNGDTVEAITAARNITVEGNGVVVTGTVDALWQLASGVNCHFLDIVGRLTSAKFNACFDLGSRDCSADHADVDGNAAITSCLLVHNAENIDLYDCIGTRVGGAGTPTVLSFASNDNCHDWAGHYTGGTRACVLDVEDLTDTYGCRSCTFNGTFFGKATGLGVELINSSSQNVFNGCESSDNQSGWGFGGGNGPANGNALIGCAANRNSQVAVVANGATKNVAIRLSAEGNTVAFAGIADAGTEFEFVDPYVNDTSTAPAIQGLIQLSTGAVVRVIGGYATTARNACHFMEINGASQGSIDANFRFNGTAANNAMVIVSSGVIRLTGSVRIVDADFGVYLNGATAYARIGQDVDLSLATTPLFIGAGAANIGTFALSGASPSVATVAFGDTKSTDKIWLTRKTAGGTAGPQPTWVNTPGTGFALSGGNADTSVYEYRIAS